MRARDVTKTGSSKRVDGIDNNHHAIIAVFRKSARPAQPCYLVVCNFDILGEQTLATDLSALLPTTNPVSCIDLLTGQSHTFASPTISLVMPKCSAKVLMF